MAAEFVLSGYANEDEYERRRPSFETDESYPYLQAATAAARSWLATQPSPEAQIEVVEVLGNEGRVRRVLGSYGSEDITYDDGR